jgi:hypothetical protein
MKQIPAYTCFLLLICLGLQAQNLPTFNSKKVTLAVPAFLPGLMADSLNAVAKNDTLFYTLQGQVFARGFAVPVGNPYTTLSTPWQTIFTMADAYAKKNKQAIINLYEPSSKSKVQSLLQGSGGNDFLSSVSVAAKANLRILAGFVYKEGWLVFTKDDLYGLHENYIIKQGTKYKLSALDDSSPVGWNVALYFKFEPKLPLPIAAITLPDSVRIESDTAVINLTVPSPRNWVAVFYGNPGSNAALLVQDNDINDFDKRPGKMTLHLPGTRFLDKGNYTLYFVCLNYPVQRFSPNFLTQQNRQIIVK